MRRDTFLKSLAALAAAGALPQAAWANASIKMMIPANPGGGWDGTGRALGKALIDAKLADTVQYDNKGGAAGVIGRGEHVFAVLGLSRLALTTGLAIGADLNVDLHEVLRHQLLAQPVAGLLQQPRDVCMGCAELHGETAGIVAEVDFHAAQLRRVEANGRALLTLLELHLNVLTQRVQHLLAPLGLWRLKLEQPLRPLRDAVGRPLDGDN